MAANRTVFVWVVIASIVVGMCGVFTEFMVRQLMFNNKIIAAKSETNDIVKKNITAYEGLKSEIEKLYLNDSLVSLKKSQDTTALQVVIDALPTEDNKAAFAASMQLEVLAPTQVRLDGFTISSAQDSTSQVAVAAGTTTTLPLGVEAVGFSFSINGRYQQIIDAIKNMERSIRPMDIQSVKFEGDDANMKANITAVTYFQPATQANLQEGVIKP